MTTPSLTEALGRIRTQVDQGNPDAVGLRFVRALLEDYDARGELIVAAQNELWWAGAVPVGLVQGAKNATAANSEAVEKLRAALIERDTLKLHLDQARELLDPDEPDTDLLELVQELVADRAEALRQRKRADTLQALLGEARDLLEQKGMDKLDRAVNSDVDDNYKHRFVQLMDLLARVDKVLPAGAR